MRALQILVIVMGVLLLAGTATIAVIIIHRMSGGHHLAAASLPVAKTGAIALPAGTHIDALGQYGDRLAIHVVGPAGETIMLLDPATGAVDQTIEVSHAP